MVKLLETAEKYYIAIRLHFPNSNSLRIMTLTKNLAFIKLKGHVSVLYGLNVFISDSNLNRPLSEPHWTANEAF